MSIEAQNSIIDEENYGILKGVVIREYERYLEVESTIIHITGLQNTARVNKGEDLLY